MRGFLIISGFTQVSQQIKVFACSKGYPTGSAKLVIYLCFYKT